MPKVNKLSVDFIRDFINKRKKNQTPVWIFDWICNAPSRVSTFTVDLHRLLNDFSCLYVYSMSLNTVHYREIDMAVRDGEQKKREVPRVHVFLMKNVTWYLSIRIRDQINHWAHHAHHNILTTQLLNIFLRLNSFKHTGFAVRDEMIPTSCKHNRTPIQAKQTRTHIHILWILLAF